MFDSRVKHVAFHRVECKIKGVNITRYNGGIVRKPRAGRRIISHLERVLIMFCYRQRSNICSVHAALCVDPLSVQSNMQSQHNGVKPVDK